MGVASGKFHHLGVQQQRSFVLVSVAQGSLCFCEITLLCTDFHGN